MCACACASERGRRFTDLSRVADTLLYMPSHYIQSASKHYNNISHRGHTSEVGHHHQKMIMASVA